LQPLAKVSEHPNILNLDATYKDEDFVHILCELCHGTRLFSIAEVQVGCAESGSSKRFSRCLQYSFATGKVHCFSTSEVSPTCSHAGEADLQNGGLAAGTCLCNISGDIVWLRDSADASPSEHQNCSLLVKPCCQMIIIMLVQCLSCKAL